MRFCPYSYHHQHRQSVSHLRSVPSYSQRICHLPTSQETYSIDKEQVSNYCPIVERVVKYRLTNHFVSNGLLNPHQSAYRTHHSSETALLYIHDHLINAIGSHELSCLCLLDLSVAFDTIDHNILITRLSSWFGIHGLPIITFFPC